MKKLLRKLLRLVGIETNIAAITSPLSKMIQELEEFAERQEKRAARDEKFAKDLLARSEEKRQVSQEALELAGEWKNSRLMARPFTLPAE